MQLTIKDHETENLEIYVSEEIILMLEELKENLVHQKKVQMAEPKYLSSQDFAIEKLQDTVKVLCREFGFTSVSQLAINKLAAILRSKITEYSQATRLFMEHAGRTQPIVPDVLAAFKLRKVSVTDVHDYAKHATCVRLNALPVFPVPDQDINKSDEAFYEAMYGPKPSQRELAERPPHIPPYMRALHPEWIEEEKAAKAEEALLMAAAKSAADYEQEEFNKLKKISTYRKVETPEEQKTREDKEERERIKREQGRARGEIYTRPPPRRPKPQLPNFMEMDFTANGFFAAYDENKKRVEAEHAETERRILKAQELAAAVPVLTPMPPAVALTEARLATEAVAKIDTNSLVSEWCDKLPVFTASSNPDAIHHDPSLAPMYDEAGPSFSFSDILKNPKVKLGGSASNPGSAPGSRPGSSLGSSLGSLTSTPEKRFGPGRPKKIKPEPTGPPKPKGRPPKKATLEKRQKLQEELLASQQKASEEAKEGVKSESTTPVKEKKERPKKKDSLDEQIRAQMLRAKSQMVLPNSVLQSMASTPEKSTPPPVLAPMIPTAPVVVQVAQVIVPEPVSQVSITMEAPLIFTDTDVPLGANEVIGEENIEADISLEGFVQLSNTDDPMPTMDIPFGDIEKIREKEKKAHKKEKKEKRDKNSEEYKEYKRLKKEKKKKEKEERKIEEKRLEAAAAAAAAGASAVEKIEKPVEKEKPEKPEKPEKAHKAPKEPKEPKPSMPEETRVPESVESPKLKLKIKFGSKATPSTPRAESPMQHESTVASSRPASSRSNPPAEPSPVPAPQEAKGLSLKFRFKNLFGGGGQESAAPPVAPTTPLSSRPSSSAAVRSETPTSSSKHHKKDKKDKKHKREKERDREKEKEREQRKERERKAKQEEEEEASRRELEEKSKVEMESSRRTEMEERERKKEKELRREEKRKEKERQKEKQERRERKERERKEKEEKAEKEREREAERERERERQAEKEKERERAREKERERERQAEKERRREEERKKKEREQKKKSPTPEPARPLIEQRESSSEESDDEELWVCPICSVAYMDGANMVGCDQCEEWFHWHCVGFTSEPTDAKWFCNRCTKGNKSKKSGKRGASGPGESTSSKRKKN